MISTRVPSLFDGQGPKHDAPARPPLPAGHEARPRGDSKARGLPPIDRFGRGDEPARPRGLHRPQEEAVAVAADKVDLAEARAHVARDDLVAVADELTLREMFAREAEDADDPQR